MFDTIVEAHTDPFWPETVYVKDRPGRSPTMASSTLPVVLPPMTNSRPPTEPTTGYCRACGSGVTAVQAFATGL